MSVELLYSVIKSIAHFDCCRWVTVDLVEGAVDKPMGVEAHCSK